MSVSIQQRINRLADGADRQELGAILQAVRRDQAALAAAVNQLIDDTVGTTAVKVVLSTTE